jgi:SAM-dependent methyltransferase
MKKAVRNLIKNILPEIFWNPIYLCEYPLRKNIEKSIKSFQINPEAKWLDVGCGLRPYEYHFPRGCYTGVDVELSGADDTMKVPDHFYDGRVIPFPDSSFDGVINTQVLEHVIDPNALILEMFRVIKPGGALILSLPFVWQEHEEPYDFLRFSSFGISNSLNKVGFEIISISKDTSAIESLAVLFNVYIINNLVPPLRGFGILITLLICLPIQLLALVMKKLLPDQGKLYLNLIITARKPISKNY